MRHDTCSHPRTPAGRAVCRRGAPQIAAQAPTPVRRVSRKRPHIELPATLTALQGYTLDVRPGYQPDEAIAEATTDAGHLLAVWSLSNPARMALSFRRAHTSLARRVRSLAQGLELLEA